MPETLIFLGKEIISKLKEIFLKLRRKHSNGPFLSFKKYPKTSPFLWIVFYWIKIPSPLKPG